MNGLNKLPNNSHGIADIQKKTAAVFLHIQNYFKEITWKLKE